MTTTLTTPSGSTVRDLNKNGRLDIYEDPSQPVDARVEDLLSQMTLAEKAGLLFQTMAPLGAWRVLPSGEELITTKLMNFFNVIGVAPVREMAEWYNALQKVAEESRLGIPVTVSTDPRHMFSDNLGANFNAGEFSHWPEPLGFAAPRFRPRRAIRRYRPPGVRGRRHSRCATSGGRCGHRTALSAHQRHLQRGRGSGRRSRRRLHSRLSGERTRADVGFLHDQTFPGRWAAKDGEDPHFPYGQGAGLSRRQLRLSPRAVREGVRGRHRPGMPYYGMPVGIGCEEVGFGFNKGIITGLLRDHYGFDGIVCSDWGLVSDANIMGKFLPARAWGVEHLSEIERVKKILDAGCDQFGGEACPHYVIELVESGQIPESRIDESAKRLLREKFILGLFDNPYVDVEAAVALVGNDEFTAAGNLAQRRSIVFLKNDAGLLPIRSTEGLCPEGIDPEALANDADVVPTVEEADLAILASRRPSNHVTNSGWKRSSTPEVSRSQTQSAIASGDHPRSADHRRHLPRPTGVIPEIAASCAALTANFGAEASAIVDVMFGRFTPEGKLPFEMPSSMDAVRAQKSDLPYDSKAPLFPFGHGLSW
ncbi:MAG: glycoside hydrolase family 3 N-terminal domain-containing protein [Thermomicrobiales bacterium]